MPQLNNNPPNFRIVDQQLPLIIMIYPEEEEEEGQIVSMVNFYLFQIKMKLFAFFQLTSHLIQAVVVVKVIIFFHGIHHLIHPWPLHFK
jgi:hypothetical protein